MSETPIIDRALTPLAVITFAVIIAGVYFAFFLAPVEGQLGIVQKIFYFHVPSAFAMYLGFAACAYGSVRYLLQPRRSFDHIARAGAEVGVLFGVIVLVTGPLWAYQSWGDYWRWEPRLTSMLLTFLVYCAYLLLRNFGGDGDLSRRIGAVMGTVGMVGVFIIHISVRLWGGVHPQVNTGDGGGIHPDMKPAFYLCIVGFLSLASLLMALRARLEARRDRVEALHLHLSDLEYELEA